MKPVVAALIKPYSPKFGRKATEAETQELNNLLQEKPDLLAELTQNHISGKSEIPQEALMVRDAGIWNTLKHWLLLYPLWDGIRELELIDTLFKEKEKDQTKIGMNNSVYTVWWYKNDNPQTSEKLTITSNFYISPQDSLSYYSEKNTDYFLKKVNQDGALKRQIM